MFELSGDEQLGSAFKAHLILLTFENPCEALAVKYFSGYSLSIIIVLTLDILNIFCKIDKRLIRGDQL